MSNAYNPVESSPTLRRNLYLAQWVVNGILGVVGVVLTALGESPVWYVITTAVFNFVWTYTGIAARGNVTVPQHRAE